MKINGHFLTNFKFDPFFYVILEREREFVGVYGTVNKGESGGLQNSGIRSVIPTFFPV